MSAFSSGIVSLLMSLQRGNESCSSELSLVQLPDILAVNRSSAYILATFDKFRSGLCWYDVVLGVFKAILWTKLDSKHESAFLPMSVVIC